jgi:hypothetical protein
MSPILQEQSYYMHTETWLDTSNRHTHDATKYAQTEFRKNRRLKHTEGVTSFFLYGIWVKPRYWKVVLLYKSYTVACVFVTKKEMMIESQIWLITDFIQQHVRNWKEYIGRTYSDGILTKIISITPEIILQNGTRKIENKKVGKAAHILNFDARWR